MTRRLILLCSLLLALSGLLGCDDDLGSGTLNDGGVDTSETDSETGAPDAGGDADTDTDTDSDSGTDTASESDTDVDTGSDSASETDALGGFGDPCELDEDCAEGVCHEFGQLGFVCTIECSDDTDCPVGSQGQKCNTQGVCRP